MEVIYLLNNANGTNAALVTSNNPYESFGQSITYIANFTGNGCSSMFISAPYHSISNLTFAGRVYVTHGFSQNMQPNQTIANLMDQYGGFYIYGPQVPFSLFGTQITNIGDVNSGGRDDIAIVSSSIRNNEVNGTGRIYVIYSEYLNGNDFYTDSLNGTNGYVLASTSNGIQMGYAVSGIGDNNNDGINDWAYGSPCFNNVILNICNSSLTVMYGSKNNFPTKIYDNQYAEYGYRIHPSNMNATSPICGNGKLEMTKKEVLIGNSISYAGKFNNDEYDDFVFGAMGAAINQWVYIIPNSTFTGNHGSGNVYILYGKNYSIYGDVYTNDINGQNGTGVFYPATDGIECQCGGFCLLVDFDTAFSSTLLGNIDIDNDGQTEIVINDFYACGPGSSGSDCVETGAAYVFSYSNLTNYMVWPNFVNLTGYFADNNGVILWGGAISSNGGRFFGNNSGSLTMLDNFYYNSYSINGQNLRPTDSNVLTCGSTCGTLDIGFGLWNFGPSNAYAIRNMFSIGDFNGDGRDDTVFTSITRDLSIPYSFYILFGSDNPCIGGCQTEVQEL